jgi:uncharacterized protein (TIGR03437 family)
MLRWAWLALLGCVLGPALVAQPYINYRGVVNAARYAPPGVPAGSIAQGAVFTVFGRGLGPAQLTQVSQFPIQTQLAGVSLRITQGSTAIDAYPLFVSSGQVGAILPSNTPLGKVALRVTYNGQQSNAAVINVVPSAVGLFAVNSSGFGPGALQNFVSATETPVNTARLTAKPGQVVILWGTGLGPIDAPDNVLPPVADLPGPIDIFVGGKLASKQYAGRSGCCAGIDQIVFAVPADAPAGCYVPVQVRTRGAIVSNAVTLAIEGSGNPCADPWNPAAGAMRAATRRALVIDERIDSLLDQEVKEPESAVRENITAVLAEGAPSDTFFNQGLSLAPPGTCTVYTDTQVRLARPNPLGTRQLDAGASLSLLGPGPTTEVNRVEGQTGVYRARLGDSPAARYTLRAPGGADIGAFETSFDVPAPLVWTNRAGTNTIGPQSPLTVNWTGVGAADLVLIRGTSADTSANSVARFVCTAEPGAASFAVPPYILQFLPPTPEYTLSPSATLAVGTVNMRAPSRIEVPALDAGYVLTVSYQVKGVIVQ